MRRLIALGAIAVVSATAVAAGITGTQSARAAGGTTYYVRAGGKDNNKGTSPSTAWKTITRVNKQNLQAGDSVLFEGGDTFSGKLYVNPNENGTSSAPITFDSYGTGRATIAGGSGSAIFVYNVGGVVIRNLVLTGSGANSNTADGLVFYNDLSGNVKRQFIRVTNVSVSGFGHYGISIGGWNGSSGFQDVQVTSSDVHDNGRGGLVTYGPGYPTYALSNVYVGHVSAYNNLGDPTMSTNSGSGIALGSVSGGTIERSVAHDNGALCRASECGVGIWAYDSTGITIDHNESYHNRTGSSVDGDGFDLDQNTSNSTVEYNYSHDNDGAGYLLWTAQGNSAWTGNTVRYNISQNDGRKNGYASILAGGRISNSNVFENTVYASPASSGTPPAVRFLSVGTAMTVRDNILYVAGGLPMVVAPSASTSALLFQDNDYFSPSGQFKVTWGSTSYTTLSSWQSASGQEKMNGTSEGKTVDPKLANPGGGGTIGNADNLASLTAYQLQATTPLLDAGLNLSQFGIAMGGQDYYSVAAPIGLGPDIGASEAP